MERKTLLIDLLAVLTLLTMANGARIGARTMMDVQDLVCRWEQSNNRLVCGFTQLEPGPITDLQYNLTLDNSETVRCQQTINKTKVIQCIFEGLQEKKIVKNKSHKFKLLVETGNQVQTQEFNLFPVGETNVDSITWVVVGCVLVLITLIILYCTVVRRLQRMHDISVTLPDFNLENNLTNIQAPK